MGGPLSPVLANSFMCHHEAVWLSNCPSEFKPLVYRRYVDDCFLIFREKSHVKLFADYLNSQHNNIKFTYELENKGILIFLDVSISKASNQFSTSVFRKDSFTGLGMNYFSSPQSITLLAKDNIV